MLTSNRRALIGDLKRWAIFPPLGETIGTKAESLYGVFYRNPWKATDELLSYVKTRIVAMRGWFLC
jgi:hypothetical protein